MTEDLRDRVLYEARDGRAYITLNRPEKRNAVTYEMFDRFMEHIRAAEEDDDVRIIVIRGEGQDFCTGHDLAQVGSEYGFSADKDSRRPSQRRRLHFDKRNVEQFRELFYCVKATISLVQGNCVGAVTYIVEATGRLGRRRRRLAPRRRAPAPPIPAATSRRTTRSGRPPMARTS